MNEFEKKIDQLTDTRWFIDFRRSYKVKPNAVNQYVSFMKLRDIIDEAKKKFPLRLSDGSLYATFGGKSDSDTIQQLIDVVDWFSTWFGDDE